MHAVSSPTSDRESLLPRTFGPYTAFERIGRGGMAQIYLARAETVLGATRLAVVKEILPAFADDPRFAEMLIHEAKLAAKLSHKHIVQVFDLGRAGDEPLGSPPEVGPHVRSERLFIAMEYVEGFDLNALLRRCTEESVGLPAPHALAIVADVLAGLDYAHRRTSEAGEPLGIVHRDVSPSNVLISFEGEVKLCDFGIAHANDLVRETSSEALKGKAGYMSPEHARGEALDARADVFAAGIILWELLAGRRLYKPRAEVPLLEQARSAAVGALPDKGLACWDRLQAIVDRALAKDRDARYPSAGAFQRDLEEYLAESSNVASRPKLGEWIVNTFGTDLVEQRRASERRLPKSSNPPPRSSERVRVGAAAPSSARIPAAPSVPAELVATSEGAMRAFKEELKTPDPPPRVSLEPSSLAALDVSPSSKLALDPSADGRPSERPLARPRRSLVLVLVLVLVLALVLLLALALTIALPSILGH